MKNNKNTEFILQNGNARKHFISIDDFKKWAKGKMPNNGDKWIIHEVITETIEHEVECERKRVYDQKIIDKILTEFINKATPENIIYGEYDTTVTDSKYLDKTYNQLIAYKIAEDIGYPWEKLDDFWNNKDNVLVGRLIDNFDNKDRLVEHLKNYSFEEAIDRLDMYIGTIAPYWILKDKYNIADEDITYNMVVDYANNDYRNIKRKIEAKYPAAYQFVKKYDDYTYPSRNKGLVVELSTKEKLAAFKERIKEYPWDKVEICYNVGDYRPCHNYKISFPYEFDPHKNWRCTYHPVGMLPGIMFRDKDIYITHSNYVGRHVNHRASQQCDVDEKLYEYCIKNLK